MSDHIRARRVLKSIPDVAAFNELLDELTISEQDKLLMRLHYIEGKDFRYIGDLMGFSESSVKKHHKRIIQKVVRHLQTVS